MKRINAWSVPTQEQPELSRLDTLLIRELAQPRMVRRPASMIACEQFVEAPKAVSVP